MYESLMRAMNANNSPWTIKQRCAADWEKMRGDDKRRFCEQCRKFVHNVSAMTSAEREALARPENMHECVYYSERSGGDIANLSFLARLRRMFPLLRIVGWSTLIGLMPVSLSGCMGVRCPRPREVQPVQPESAPNSPQSTNQTGSAQSSR